MRPRQGFRLKPFPLPASPSPRRLVWGRRNYFWCIHGDCRDPYQSVAWWGCRETHLWMESARLGKLTHSSQPRTPRHSSGEAGRGWVGCGNPRLAVRPCPLSSAAARWETRSPAAQSGPLAARRIAGPPWPIQSASAAQFPPAQSAPGPAPSGRGSHPTLTQDPVTTIATHHPLCTRHTLRARSPRLSLRKYLRLRALARSPGPAPKVLEVQRTPRLITISSPGFYHSA